MSGETERQSRRMDEQTEQMNRRRNSRTNGQTDGWTSGQNRWNRWTGGETAERMDKRADGRADRAGQSRQSRQSRTNKQRDEAERRSRQAKQTDCRLLAPPFGRFAKHRTESCRRQKKRQSAPEKPDGSGNRERKPGADRTEVETGSRSDGSGSAKKTIRNQRTIISVCPSALTLCDARQ